VADDQKQVRAYERQQHNGEYPDVTGEEPLQGERAQVGAAAQGFENELAEEGNGPCDLRADGGGPVRALVPREQVAGEAHAECGDQQADADQPGQFTRVLVRGSDKDTQQMEEDHDHHERRTPVMDAADQPAEGHVVHDVGDAVVGVIGRGGVINRQENSRCALQNEQEQAGRAERVPPVPFRFRAFEQVFLHFVQAEAFIQPGEDFFPHSFSPENVAVGRAVR